MGWKGLIFGGLAAGLLSANLAAVPPEYKKDLKEPRSIITKCKTNVYYRKKYEGMAEKLNQAKEMLMQVAEKAGVDEKDPDIARLLKSIGKTREKLNKELEKQGKVPGAVENNPMKIKKTTKTPGAVKNNPMEIKKTTKTPGKITPSASEKKETNAANTETGKMDVKEIRTAVNKAYSDIYYRKKYEGKREELAGYEARLKELDPDGTNSDAQRVHKKIERARKQLAKHDAKIAKQEEYKKKKAAEKKATQAKLGDSLKVYKATRDRVFDMHALLDKIKKTENKDEFYELAAQSNKIFTQARALHTEVMKGIPDLREFERNYDEAMKNGYRRKVEGIESLLDNGAVHRVQMTRKELINKCHSDLASMKHYTKVTLAAADLGKIKKRFALLDQIAKGDPEVAKEKNQILPAAEKAYKKLLDKVANTKMSAEKYGGGDAAAIKNVMKKRYEAKYPDKVLKVVITSEDWKKQAVAEVNNDDKIVANYYAYIYADMAVKKKNGCVVYPMGFRKAWTGKEDEFGSLEIRSIGVSYPILEKNVK